MWDDRLQNHAAVAALDRAAELAGPAKATAEDHPDAQVVQYIDATAAIVGDVRTRLLTADSRLVTEGSLTRITDPAITLQNYLTGFSELGLDEQLGRASLVHGQAEELLLQAILIPSTPWSHDADGVVRRAAQRLRDRVAEIRREAETDFQRQKAASDAAATALGEQHGQLEGQVDGISERIMVIQELADTLGARINEQSAESNRRFDAINDQFNQDQVNRAEAFVEAQGQRQVDFTSSLSEDRSQWDSELSSKSGAWDISLADQIGLWDASLTGQNERAARLEGHLDDLVSRAEGVLGISAAANVSGAAVQEAEEQRAAADQQRKVGLGALAVGALTAAGALALSLVDPPSDLGGSETLVLLLTRFGVTGFVGAIAAYALKESGKHRDRERAARQTFIDLSSFRPFLAELSEDEQRIETRIAVRRHFFREASSDDGLVRDLLSADGEDSAQDGAQT